MDYSALIKSKVELTFFIVLEIHRRLKVVFVGTAHRATGSTRRIPVLRLLRSSAEPDPFLDYPQDEIQWN
jgi:hypothetical protein